MAYWTKIRRRAFWKSRLNPKRIRRTRLMLRIAKFGFISVIAGFLGFFIILPFLAFNLPSPDKVVRKEGFSTKILDRNGKVLYDIYADQKRTPVEIDKIPKSLKDATIAIEDKNFYSHQGFDIFGIVRGFSRIFTRGYAQGGSTLTQQLVKNVLLTSERSIIRKLREFILAIQIERRYSKDQILQMYLNEAPYGGTAWGVEAASEMYFGKSVSDLNLVESAILAGLPQRPSVYSPYSSEPKAYIERTKQVLRRMREDGYISEDEENKAKKELEEIKFQERGANFKAPHFVQYVQKILEERYGQRVVEQGGLKVITTLDLDLQEKAQKIVAEEIEKVKKLNITNGAAVILDPQTGEILAMIGSRGFSDPEIDGQVNVTVALRQPGSAIKPFTYVTAFKKGYTASTLLMDVPTEFFQGEGLPLYKPVNYDGKFRGPVQVRYALANSINIPAVKMLAMVGLKDTLQTAYELGINSLEPTKETLSKVGLSLTLGGGEVRLLELTSAYAAFLNTGFKVDPVAILKVVDSKGKVLEEAKPEKVKRVLSPEQAYLIFDILSDNEARSAVFGSNSLLNIPGRQVAVKTGTTNGKRDNWTIGGNSQTLVGVWVGNNDNSEMLEVASGVSGASPIWRRILLETLNGKPNITMEVPGGIVNYAVDSISGYTAHDGFPSRIEKFIVGTEPGEDPIHVKLKVCKTDYKLATPSDITNGNYEEREYFIFKEKDPLAKSDRENKWQEGINLWLSSQTDPRYHPPSEYCGTPNPLGIEFIQPVDKSSNLPNKFNIEIRADSLYEVTEVNLDIDGLRVKSFNKRPFSYQVDLGNGVHILKARARDSGGNESEKSIIVGVGVSWDFTPSPTPTLTPTSIPTLTPVLTP